MTDKPNDENDKINASDAAVAEAINNANAEIQAKIANIFSSLGNIATNAIGTKDGAYFCQAITECRIWAKEVANFANVQNSLAVDTMKNLQDEILNSTALNEKLNAIDDGMAVMDSSEVKNVAESSSAIEGGEGVADIKESKPRKRKTH